MGKEISTRSKAPSAVSTQTSEDAKTAFELRQRGRSFGYICDHTSFNDPTEVARAIKSYEAGLAAVRQTEWQEGIDMELSRYDELQAEAWEIISNPPGKYDKDGVFLEHDMATKLKAMDTVLKVMKQRAELRGYTTVDPSDQKGIVVLVQGQEGTADYVKDLKRVVEAQELPASTKPGS